MAIELLESPETVNIAFSDVVKGASTTPAPLEKLTEYHERLGTSLKSSKVGSAFFNGKPYIFDGVSA